MRDDVVIDNANAIKEQYMGDNVTATGTLQMLDLLVQSVYHSTPDKAITPYACEFNGLAKLDCEATGLDVGSPRKDGSPIRSVTLAGIFIPALWATHGKPLSLKEAKHWYGLQDFMDIKSLGLNTVQIPVPTAAFTAKDEYGARVKEVLDALLENVQTAGLQAILSLVSSGDEQEAVVAAAQYASEKPMVLAMSLPSGMTLYTKTLVAAIRVEALALPIFIPTNAGNLIKMNAEFDSNVYGSLEAPHSVFVADIASSTSEDDRSKLFYHEATSCMARSPMEYSACFQKMPIFLSSGFDLSVDDCINKNITTDFKDYGQCDRFSETTESGWWFRHRQSFAARQLFAYERGLGWSFATWKLFNNKNVGEIDTPAKLLSLQDVAAAGLFPDLDDPIPAEVACLNPPKTDFVLGDDTLSPTMGPLPDCGNGWWNATTTQCDYWIPPPDPTSSPTVSCPVCVECLMLDPAQSSMALVEVGLAGALGGALVVAALFKWCSPNRRSEYSAIPN
jgi:hypothetical protein